MEVTCKCELPFLNAMTISDIQELSQTAATCTLLSVIEIDKLELGLSKS